MCLRFNSRSAFILRKTMYKLNSLQTAIIHLASYPGPFEKSEKRAWYPLFVHALN